MQFFRMIFDTEGFIPKRFAGPAWTENLMYLDIFSHVIIIFAFLTIPFSLYYLKANRIDTAIKPHVYSIFYWFSIICALTRCSSIFVYFWPASRFYILLNYLYAFAVCILAWKLKNALDYLINLPPLSLIQEENERQERELGMRREEQCRLQIEVNKLNGLILNLQDILQREVWVHDRQGTIEVLEKMLAQLGKSSDEIPAFKPNP